MSKPVCSIVIPAYNARRYLAECLSSVLEQETEFPFEVIVVDDGSTDGSADLIRKRFPTVRLFQKENGGPGSARNRAATEAESDILVFIDADDAMLPGRLDHQVGYMLEHPEIGLTFGNQRNERRPQWDANEHKKICKGQESYVVLENAFERLLVENSFIQNTATAVRRDAYLETGGQPEHIFVGEDYSMYCNIAREYPIAATNRFLTWYRQSGGGNIMASHHTYAGPPHALKTQLDRHIPVCCAKMLFGPRSPACAE